MYSYRFAEANEWQKLNCDVNYKLIGRRETFGVEAGRVAYAQNTLMLCTDKSKQTKREFFYIHCHSCHGTLQRMYEQRIPGDEANENKHTASYLE